MDINKLFHNWKSQFPAIDTNVEHFLATTKIHGVYTAFNLYLSTDKLDLLRQGYNSVRAHDSWTHAQTKQLYYDIDAIHAALNIAHHPINYDTHCLRIKRNYVLKEAFCLQGHSDIYLSNLTTVYFALSNLLHEQETSIYNKEIVNQTTSLLTYVSWLLLLYLGVTHNTQRGNTTGLHRTFEPNYIIPDNYVSYMTKLKSRIIR